MPRTNVLALWVALAALVVAGLAWRASRGAAPELAFRCAAHACACRDAVACLADCCCEPHADRGSVAAHHGAPLHAAAPTFAWRSVVPDPRAAESWRGAESSAIESAADRELQIDATLAPARCGGRPDERIATASTPVPALVAERRARALERAASGRAPLARVEPHEATTIAPPSPPPRGTLDAA